MECAGEQDAFFDYKALVFSNQGLLSQQSSFTNWAEELNLDIDKFTTCLNEQRYSSKVIADTNEGGANGFGGTPSFVIGSTTLVGAHPFSNFQAAIDAQLAN